MARREHLSMAFRNFFVFVSVLYEEQDVKESEPQ